jgi:hypothetical protein
MCVREWSRWIAFEHDKQTTTWRVGSTYSAYCLKSGEVASCCCGVDDCDESYRSLSSSGGGGDDWMRLLDVGDARAGEGDDWLRSFESGSVGVGEVKDGLK